jgi:tetraacyldisaccharide-1-P 4'-kinase
MFIIITRGSDGGLKHYTTRMTTSDTASEVHDELLRVQDKPGATVTVKVEVEH